MTVYVRDVEGTWLNVRYNRIVLVSEEEWRLLDVRSTVFNNDRQISSDVAFIGSRSQQHEAVCRAVSETHPVASATICEIVRPHPTPGDVIAIIMILFQANDKNSLYRKREVKIVLSENALISYLKYPVITRTLYTT